jgi:hypothetical protein
MSLFACAPADPPAGAHSPGPHGRICSVSSPTDGLAAALHALLLRDPHPRPWLRALDVDAPGLAAERVRRLFAPGTSLQVLDCGGALLGLCAAQTAPPLQQALDERAWHLETVVAAEAPPGSSDALVARTLAAIRPQADRICARVPLDDVRVFHALRRSGFDTMGRDLLAVGTPGRSRPDPRAPVVRLGPEWLEPAVELLVRRPPVHPALVYNRRSPGWLRTAWRAWLECCIDDPERESWLAVRDGRVAGLVFVQRDRRLQRLTGRGAASLAPLQTKGPCRDCDPLTALLKRALDRLAQRGIELVTSRWPAGSDRLAVPPPAAGLGFRPAGAEWLLETVPPPS